MNYREYRSITINSIFLDGEEIISYCAGSDIENVRNIGIFLQIWLNDSPYIEVQTSGSTGKPKTIQIAKNEMLASAAMTASYFEFQLGQTALLCLPVSYIAGKMMVVRAMLSRLNLICIDPSAHPIEALSENLTTDFAPLIPMQVQQLTDSKSIKKILLGGAPIDTELERRLVTLKAEVYHGYGMTETLSHIAVRRVNGPNRSHTYQGLPGVRFTQDEEGCLIIDVPFLDDPVYTRDIVSLTGHNTFIWKGRADNVVNSGGVKLHPETIEEKLTSLIDHPYFVAGIADKKLGEKLCLFIESSPYSKEKLLHLQYVISKTIDKYSRPRDIIFIPAFLMTESGKIRRKDTLNLIKV